MNYFDIFIRVFAATLTFAIGLTLVGSPGASDPPTRPRPLQTRGDALEAELEAMNAFYGLIESDRKAKEAASLNAEAAEAAASKDAEGIEVRRSNYAPEGDFEIILGNEGAFKNVESFYLITSRYYPDEGLSKPIIPEGAITISGNEFEFKSLLVDPLKVAFTTRSTRGTSYRFEGNVAVRYYKEDYEAVVITGTLSKYLNGSRVFHDVVEFEEISGC